MRLVIIFALSVLGSPVSADQGKPAIEYERQESLEIPGLTAGCHICEWRPKLNNMPAPDQCGTDEAGEPLVGLFQCGYSEDCQRICNFLGCEER
jgi:hypothetical protein